MKSIVFSLLVTAVCWMQCGRFAAAATVPPPRITSITFEAESLVVRVEVPEGVGRVLIEGSRRADLRAWWPRASKTVARAGEIVFRIPASAAAGMEMFRARAEDRDVVPSKFFEGPSDFGGSLQASGKSQAFQVPLNSEGVLRFDTAGVPLDAAASGGLSISTRTVTESDIWKIRGDFLYLFNQLRGLQIIDLSDADSPNLLSTLSLPSSGEDLYLVGENHVALLARTRPCADNSNPTNASSLIVVDVSGNEAREVARVPLNGRILESRLVGEALYVATETWQAVTTDGDESYATWVNGTVVTGIDLSNPTTPVANPEVWLAGSGNVVTATEKFLFVGTTDPQRPMGWWRSDLRVLDISDPGGRVRDTGSVALEGRVADKFKIHVSGDILTVIVNGPEHADGSGIWRSVLSTYRLDSHPAGGGSPATPLGRVEVGHGENLYATRFDGNRAYVVTFRRIDPLWIIDLSQPENPRVLGELEIPGWSTYIHPLGDRLLTVGVDDTRGTRVAVQLFDVADGTKPRLLSKVPLGTEWSWSEANDTEKALAVFAEQELVLLPFSSSTSTGTVQGVQLLDLKQNQLTARGVIRSSQVVPRRSTLRGERILAVSSRELVTVDASDRDRPILKDTLPLAAPVERIVVAGSWLLELSGTTLHVRSSADAVTDEQWYALGAGPVFGAAAREDRLYVLQGRANEVVVWDFNGVMQPGGTAILSIYDLSDLPNLTIVGSVTNEIPELSGSDFVAVWPAPGVLVWDATQNGSYPFPLFLADAGGVVRFDDNQFNASPAVTFVGPVDSRMAPIEISIDFFPSIRPGLWWYPMSRDILVYDVSLPETPRFTQRLAPPQEATDRSPVYESGGLLYYSHDTQTSEIGGTNSFLTVSGEWVKETVEKWVTNVVRVPFETLVTNIVNESTTLAGWSQQLAPTERVVAGPYNALALTSDGGVLAWGDNRSGQLGFLNVDGTQPQSVALPTAATDLAATAWFSLSRVADGTVWMWGSPGGPLPPPAPGTPIDQTPEVAPRLLSGLPSDARIADIEAGFEHVLARSSDGRLFAWGRNDQGQLGVGDRSDRSGASFVISNVVAAAGGALHSVALNSDGAALTWGDNRQGQLGHPPGDSHSLPELIPGLPALVAIDAGDWHSLGLEANGVVWAWGDSGETPLQEPVIGLPPMQTAVAAGRYSIGLDREGVVWTWGGKAKPPLPLKGLGTIRSLDACGGYALILDADNTCHILRFGEYPAPATGNRRWFTFSGATSTNVLPGIDYRLETNVVWKVVEERRWREVTVTNTVPYYRTLTHHHLNVVDFAGGATDPVERPVVSLPGALRGLSHDGTLLYTMDTRLASEITPVWETWLEAVAYDGVAAHLVTSVKLIDTTRGGSATVAADPRGLVISVVQEGSTPSVLEIRKLNTEGVFQVLDSKPLASWGTALEQRDGLLITGGGLSVEVFDLSDTGTAVLLEVSFEQGCLLPALSRIAGDRASGLWAPLGDFGTAMVWKP